MAINDAPKIVSGLVVKIFIFFTESESLKSISQPTDFPIQFFLHVFYFFWPIIQII